MAIAFVVLHFVPLSSKVASLGSSCLPNSSSAITNTKYTILSGGLSQFKKIVSNPRQLGIQQSLACSQAAKNTAKLYLW